MNQESLHLKGYVKKTKLISNQSQPMAYLDLETGQGDVVHALVVHQALSFLLDVQVGDPLALYGHYNDRRQFIVHKYLSHHKGINSHDHTLPPHLKYPYQRKEN